MFLKKITKLKSVGRFRSGGVSGGEYAKYTLFYGGNGRGKTTICAAIRSFQKNDPAYLLERSTFGATGSPEVQLLLDTGIATFLNGAWTATSSDIHIFDGRFVTENIHSGEELSIDQRRNFYRVVVGSTGVALAEALDAIDAKVSAANTALSTAKKVLQQHVPSGFSFDQFLGFVADPDIDAKLAAAKSRLNAIENSAAIAAGKSFAAAPIPELPATVESSCAKTVANVLTDAQQRVRIHLDVHAFEDGETWLLEGFRMRRGDGCPFCGIALDGNAMLAAYNAYFSQAYSDLKQSILDLRSDTESAVSVAAGLLLLQGLKAQDDCNAFWSQYLQLPTHELAGVDDLREALAILRKRALEMVDAKLSSPLEQLTPDAGLVAAAARWKEICDVLSARNTAMLANNASIAAAKQATDVRDRDAVAKDVSRLQAISNRHSPAVSLLANEYGGLLQVKNELVAEKDTTKASLDQYDSNVLQQYELAINTFLDVFGASFRITGSTKNYVGKTPQSVFGIQFDGHTVNVASTTQDGAPSFRTTLSMGDKSTLALAFFLAQLERDSSLSSKLVVFDDPFTSLDDFRREMTAKSIVRVGTSASQVLVFSHDK